MPYDAAFPPDHQALDAAPFREQFQGLKALIDDKPSTDDVSQLIATQAALNCSAVIAPVMTISNPPTQAEVQALADKLVELINTLQRPQ